MNAIEKRAALAGAMQKAFGTLLRDGSTGNLDFPAIALSAIHALMGFEEVWDFERRWAREESAQVPE